MDIVSARQQMKAAADVVSYPYTSQGLLTILQKLGRTYPVTVVFRIHFNDKHT
jgi:hypothetical protein